MLNSLIRTSNALNAKKWNWTSKNVTKLRWKTSPQLTKPKEIYRISTGAKFRLISSSRGESKLTLLPKLSQRTWIRFSKISSPNLRRPPVMCQTHMIFPRTAWVKQPWLIPRSCRKKIQFNNYRWLQCIWIHILTHHSHNFHRIKWCLHLPLRCTWRNHFRCKTPSWDQTLHRLRSSITLILTLHLMITRTCMEVVDRIIWTIRLILMWETRGLVPVVRPPALASTDDITILTSNNKMI